MAHLLDPKLSDAQVEAKLKESLDILKRTFLAFDNGASSTHKEFKDDPLYKELVAGIRIHTLSLHYTDDILHKFKKIAYYEMMADSEKHKYEDSLDSRKKAIMTYYVKEQELVDKHAKHVNGLVRSVLAKLNNSSMSGGMFGCTSAGSAFAFIGILAVIVLVIFGFFVFAMTQVYKTHGGSGDRYIKYMIQVQKTMNLTKYQVQKMLNILKVSTTREWDCLYAMLKMFKGKEYISRKSDCECVADVEKWAQLLGSKELMDALKQHKKDITCPSQKSTAAKGGNKIKAGRKNDIKKA